MMTNDAFLEMTSLPAHLLSAPGQDQPAPAGNKQILQPSTMDASILAIMDSAAAIKQAGKG